MIKCRKKSCYGIVNENEVQLHHLIPKCIGGTDLDGRRYLCKKHHDIIGLKIIPILFNYIPPEKKEEAKTKIKEYTLQWLKTG